MSAIDPYILSGVIIVAQILAIVVPLLVAVAYLTYAERKVIGAIQLRKGPRKQSCRPARTSSSSSSRQC